MNMSSNCLLEDIDINKDIEKELKDVKEVIGDEAIIEKMVDALIQRYEDVKYYLIKNKNNISSDEEIMLVSIDGILLRLADIKKRLNKN